MNENRRVPAADTRGQDSMRHYYYYYLYCVSSSTIPLTAIGARPSRYYHIGPYLNKSTYTISEKCSFLQASQRNHLSTFTLS